MLWGGGTEPVLFNKMRTEAGAEGWVLNSVPKATQPVHERVEFKGQVQEWSLGHFTVSNSQIIIIDLVSVIRHRG
jgi:hypothetical protein